MRFTVSKKISLGVALILLTGSVSMVIIYQGLTAIERTLHKLSEVKEPTITAANEMEINANGIMLGVLKVSGCPGAAIPQARRTRRSRLRKIPC
jgi:hypothetical protein